MNRYEINKMNPEWVKKRKEYYKEWYQKNKIKYIEKRKEYQKNYYKCKQNNKYNNQDINLTRSKVHYNHDNNLNYSFNKVSKIIIFS
tara:strand:- start:2354 stop:2614 length:261 start_codon:yes stop_codon:yes gene_type:complete